MSYKHPPIIVVSGLYEDYSKHNKDKLLNKSTDQSIINQLIEWPLNLKYLSFIDMVLKPWLIIRYLC